MKVLIVEDIKFRQDLIKQKIELEDVNATKKADKALELLERYAYDLVFLDHDLIGMRSGSYLTQRWYEALKKNPAKFKTQKPIVIIHSMNMIGASKMENYLKGISKVTKRIPFKLIVTNKVDLKAAVVDLAG